MNALYFENLPSDKQELILDYELMVYVCTGTPSEKLDWFTTINTAGEELTNQELRNAVYAGPWLSDAKRYFSRNGCAAYGIGNAYVNGRVNPTTLFGDSDQVDQRKTRLKTTWGCINTTKTQRPYGSIFNR